MASVKVDGRMSAGRKRRQEICRLLQEQGYLDVTELGRQLGVNVVTIRRDLDRLEATGLLRRAHGGAFACPTDVGAELDFRVRENFQADAKRRIAMQVASMIDDGDTVYIDAGTTTQLVAEALSERHNLAIVTHSLEAATPLAQSQGIDLYLIGGHHLNLSRCLVGPSAEEDIRRYRCRKMILGTAGIDFKNQALTLSAMEEVPIKRAAIAQSEQVILVADAAKFNKPSLISMIPLQSIDILVTDEMPPAECMAVLDQLEVKVVVAGDKP